ncbi:MAG: MlaD family protein [Nevskiaceae bacterium]|jgi:phospholipid/cholesterol/gamma-HCH transport system substrate-binding protein|nr:MlaD family protein [Nevskiaceae bacterium]
MEREANYTAVGAFVILVTVMAGLFVYWYSDGRERRSYQPWEIYFAGSVSGLSQGGPVRYLGVDVGRVRTIRIDPRDAARVQVVADIDRSTPVSEDTTAQLSLAGVTGLLFIDLRQNVSQREVMPPVPSEQYRVINTVPSGFDAFLSQLPVLADSATNLLERMQVVFSESNSESLGRMIQNLAVTSEQMPDTMKNVNALLIELNGTGAEIRRLSAGLNQTLPSLGTKVGDLVDSLQKTSVNLEQASAQLIDLMAKNGDSVTGFTRDGLPELERTLRETRKTVEQLSALAESLQQDPSRVLYRRPLGGVKVPR